MAQENETRNGEQSGLPEIAVPAGWTLAALGGGLAAGLALPAGVLAPALQVAEPLGALWLKGLQMTILPLVVSLLVIGTVHTVEAARGGAMARRTLGLIATFLVGGAVMAAVVTPLLIALFPIPAAASRALAAAMPASGPALPGIAAFLETLVPDNVFAAAAAGTVLPVIVFFALFAVALTRLPAGQRASLLPIFEGMAAAMMVVIGWVLWLAPLGVFALALGVAAKTGAAAFALLAHYIAVVASVGGVLMVLGFVIAAAAGLGLAAYARAMLPVLAVAASTQSSLASLPAMLAACRKLGVREASADFVLPLAVALFRATGPAMNLAVAIYVAKMAGMELTPAMLLAGITTASLTTLGSPSISGILSFVSAVGPIALAMGVPVGPLALLVAVEMLPDLMRTLGNVCMDVALAGTVDRWGKRTASPG